jgi:hypothetical protein
MSLRHTQKKYFLFIYCEREAEESNKNNDDEFISHDLTRKKDKIDVAASSDIHCLMLCMVLPGYNGSKHPSNNKCHIETIYDYMEIFGVSQ